MTASPFTLTVMVLEVSLPVKLTVPVRSWKSSAVMPLPVPMVQVTSPSPMPLARVP